MLLLQLWLKLLLWWKVWPYGVFYVPYYISWQKETTNIMTEDAEHTKWRCGIPSSMFNDICMRRMNNFTKISSFFIELINGLSRTFKTQEATVTTGAATQLHPYVNAFSSKPCIFPKRHIYFALLYYYVQPKAKFAFAFSRQTCHSCRGNCSTVHGQPSRLQLNTCPNMSISFWARPWPPLRTHLSCWWSHLMLATRDTALEGLYIIVIYVHRKLQKQPVF